MSGQYGDRIRKITNRLLSLRPSVYASVIFFIALLARLGYWQLVGTVYPASSDPFLSFCSPLFGDPIGLFTATEPYQWEVTARVLYSGYWIPLCIVSSLPYGSPESMILVQILLSSLACVLVFYTGYRQTNLVGGLVAGIGLAVLMEGFAWTTRILADSMLVFVLTTAVWALSRYYDAPSRRRLLVVYCIFSYLAITRPFGAPLVVGFLGYDLFFRRSADRARIVPFPQVILTLVILLLPLLTYIALEVIGFGIVSRWEEGILLAADSTFPRYPYTPRGGETLFSFIILNIDHLIIMGVLKIIVFFLPFVPRFSTLHIVINLFTYVPLFALGFWGIWKAARDRDPQLWFCVTPITVVVTIVAATFVDYSWGFRAPVGPLFALLAGYALATTTWVQEQISEYQ